MSDLVYFRDGETDEDGMKVIKSDAYFVFEQNTPLDVWDVYLPLNKYSSVSIVDQNGYEIEGSVLRVSEGHTRISFNSAIAGKAYFN
jgi:hypothetical protein